MSPALSPTRLLRLARLMFWLVPLVWSSNYIIARAANGVVPAHALALGRWLVAALLLLPFVWRDRLEMWRVASAQWGRWLILGALGVWVCGAFVYIAGQTTSASNMALIYAATPIGIAVTGGLLFGERLSLAQGVAMLLACCGVLLVISQGDPVRLVEVRFTGGDLWMLGAGVAWVAYSVLQQKWPAPLSSVQRLFCIAVGGLVWLVPLAALESAFFQGPAITGQALLLMAAAGLVPGVLAYLMYNFMVAQIGATRAGLAMYLSPLYAAVVAYLVFGEVPHWFHLAGAALVIPGLLVSGRMRSGSSPGRPEAPAK